MTHTQPRQAFRSSADGTTIALTVTGHDAGADAPGHSLEREQEDIAAALAFVS